MKRFEYAHVAEGIARQAGALLREFYKKGVETEYKGDVDLVTEADRASEALIREKLTAAFPGHGIFGEEGTRDQLESEFRWYVDPLDGTTNFSHGFPAFCVVLGLERRGAGVAADADGEMIAGVIYDPLRDEMFSTERGKGAWLNGRQIHVSKTETLQEALTATGFPSHKRHASPNVHFYQEFTLRSHGVRRAGSAALDMAYVACGRLDGFWEFKLNPWDTSAGYLLVEEVTHFDGVKFTLDSREVLATNGLIAGEMRELFVEMFAGRGLAAIPTPAEFAAKRKAEGR
jgi:myo-inositol-1(or 4)-monophosphatase